MKSMNLFFLEWKHFVRSPFKVIAVVLFVVAGAYGLHNGASLYHEQMAELARIEKKAEEDRQPYLGYYDAGKMGPEGRPWIDITTPRWAIWYNGIYHFKTPSPALVYSTGQAEQYGFYKRVTSRSSPYDSDLTKEIANPERLQTGTLDFSFALLFLLPLLLLILLYNLKSAEAEQGFLPLIQVQATSERAWLLRRWGFYVGFVSIVVIGLLAYGLLLTPVFPSAGGAFAQILVYSLLYLLFWAIAYLIILFSGKTVIGNSLKMVGVWLLFTFVMPATVHQWISMTKPANLMTEFIDATRDKRQQLFDQPDRVIQAQLDAMFPEIVNSPVARDSAKKYKAMNESAVALANELTKESIAAIEAENHEKNEMIRASYWYNPLTFFQNRFNQITQTHYNDYQQYRNEIQTLIDKQIRTLVLDTWHEVKVDKEKYVEYNRVLHSLE